MRTLKIILIAIFLLLCAGITIYAYYGGFEKIVFFTSKQGGDMLVYEEMKGDYNQAGKVIERISGALNKEAGIQRTKGFGVYYDNPSQVEKNNLRSDIGCIVDHADSSKLDALTKTYKIKTMAEDTYLTTKFPYKGTISIILGVLKVYPAMETFVSLKGKPDKVPVMEIYDLENREILYLRKLN